MLPLTVAPAFVCQGPVYDIKGERAVMLTDLLAILRRPGLVPRLELRGLEVGLSGGPDIRATLCE